MQDNPRHSIERITKLTPWLCVGSLAVVVATFAYNKLYIVAVVIAPVIGLLSFAAFLAYWRTGKEWLEHSVLVLFIILSSNASGAGLLWGLPQSLAIAVLFMSAPMLLFREPIDRWLSRKHS